jgi:hypothetical protein
VASTAAGIPSLFSTIRGWNNIYSPGLPIGKLEKITPAQLAGRTSAIGDFVSIL